MLSDIKNKIREIIADEVGLELDQIGDDTLLLSDGILDSSHCGRLFLQPPIPSGRTTGGTCLLASVTTRFDIEAFGR